MGRLPGSHGRQALIFSRMESIEAGVHGVVRGSERVRAIYRQDHERLTEIELRHDERENSRI